MDDTQRDIVEESDPHVQRALEQVRLQNWDRAIGHLEKALTNDPALGRPHLELALIYHQRVPDLVRAIYHYERYLERRPETEKRALIQDWIRQARIALAGEIGRTSGDITEELVRLRRENQILREQLAAFERRPSASTPGASVVGQAGDASEEEPRDETALKENDAGMNGSEETVDQQKELTPAIYTVVAGDTLMGIARKVYGQSTRWREIFEANRDQMKHEADLKVGQRLRIPRD